MPPAVTAMGIRSMIAQEKLAQLSMLAPKDYRSQIRAHFGVDVDKCSDCASQYIGSYNSQLNIGEVTATASTSGDSSSKLGQIAGKGVSSSSSSLKFTSKDCGIMMGIHYFSNESDYSSTGLDQFNSKVLRSDYYQPEYDSLGMQPINASVS